jgi:hypothetical protein
MTFKSYLFLGGPLHGTTKKLPTRKDCVTGQLYPASNEPVVTEHSSTEYVAETFEHVLYDVFSPKDSKRVRFTIYVHGDKAQYEDFDVLMLLVKNGLLTERFTLPDEEKEA